MKSTRKNSRNTRSVQCVYTARERTMPKLIAAIGCMSILVLTGCDMEAVTTGPVQSDSRSIERDKSELVRADLRMGAGELNVRGGAQKMMEAYFRYNVS